MRKIAFLTIVFTWILGGCAGSGNQTPQSELPVTGTEPVPLVESTASPVEATVESPAAKTAEPTEASLPATVVTTHAAVQAAAGSGVVTYFLVPEESTLTYEVGETFIDRGNVFSVAAGETPGVIGEVQVNFDRPQDSLLSPLSADISRLTSDNGRRDNAIRDRFLESSQYPTVTFTPSAIEGLPETIEAGVEYPLTLRGDLTIRETTRPAVFDARVRLQDGALTGQAITTFLMSDYGFGPIDILGILKTEDQVKITVDFVARPQ